MATEEPQYQLLRKDGDFEIRKYAPMLIAETVVQGDMDTASSVGFRRIANFIFGNNEAPVAQQPAKIAMTAPVTIEPQSAKIAMTAPVTIEPQAAASMQGTTNWRIHFVMPSQYTPATLPRPKDANVRVREIPEKFFVVRRYSGFNGQGRVQKEVEQTLAWISSQQLKPQGAPQLSRYDPPWTLPMFRRNEIMVEIEPIPSTTQ